MWFSNKEDLHQNKWRDGEIHASGLQTNSSFENLEKFKYESFE